MFSAAGGKEDSKIFFQSQQRILSNERFAATNANFPSFVTCALIGALTLVLATLAYGRIKEVIRVLDKKLKEAESKENKGFSGKELQKEIERIKETKRFYKDISLKHAKHQIITNVIPFLEVAIVMPTVAVMCFIAAPWLQKKYDITIMPNFSSNTGMVMYCIAVCVAVMVVICYILHVIGVREHCPSGALANPPFDYLGAELIFNRNTTTREFLFYLSEDQIFGRLSDETERAIVIKLELLQLWNSLTTNDRKLCVRKDGMGDIDSSLFLSKITELSVSHNKNASWSRDRVERLKRLLFWEMLHKNGSTTGFFVKHPDGMQKEKNASQTSVALNHEKFNDAFSKFIMNARDLGPFLEGCTENIRLSKREREHLNLIISTKYQLGILLRFLPADTLLKVMCGICCISPALNMNKLIDEAAMQRIMSYNDQMRIKEAPYHTVIRWTLTVLSLPIHAALVSVHLIDSLVGLIADFMEGIAKLFFHSTPKKTLLEDSRFCKSMAHTLNHFRMLCTDVYTVATLGNIDPTRVTGTRFDAAKVIGMCNSAEQEAKENNPDSRRISCCSV